MTDKTKLVGDAYRAIVKGDIERARQLVRELKAFPNGKAESTIFQTMIVYEANPAEATLRDMLLCQMKVGTNPFLIAYGWRALVKTPVGAPAVLASFTELTIAILDNGGMDDEIVYSIVLNSGKAYGAHAPKEAYLFQNLVVPIIRRASESKRFNLLMECEVAVYKHFIIKQDREEHFAERYRVLIPFCREAGARFINEQTQVAAAYNAALDSRPQIMFLLHSTSRLAHIETMLASFRAYRHQPFQPFDPIVVVLQGVDEWLKSECEQLKINVIFLESLFPDGIRPSPIDLLILVRQLLAKWLCSVIVFVSNVTMMAFYFGSRIAPVQIWWSMKYTSFEMPEIDGYITGGQSDFREINGRTWRSIPHGATDWFDADAGPEAAAMRAELAADKRLILGCFGREEKLRDAKFLDAVCQILERHPHCLFLWTGRTQDDLISKTFAQRDLTARTRFIGWVNTKVAAQVIDIFLDSFPMPAGFTIYQAMAAGVPAVLYEVPEATLGIQVSISRLYFGQEGTPKRQARVSELFAKSSSRPLYFLARDVPEYVAHASALIEDAHLRRAAGHAGKQFIEEFMSDSSRMGAAFAKHFWEIVRLKLPDHGPAANSGRTAESQESENDILRGVNASTDLAGTP